MEYKKIYVVLFVVFLISVFSGVTFSFWQWQSSENTAVAFEIESGGGESCALVDGGGNITSSEIVLAPASCTNSKYAIKREINITPVITEGSLTGLNLWLNINNLGTGLSNSQNFKYVLTTSDSSCTDEVVASGNFNGKVVGDTVPLLSEKIYETETVDTYYLYVWLDSAETCSSTMYQSFDLSIGGDCNQLFNVTLNANGGAISSVSYTVSGEHTYAVPYDAIYRLETWGAQGGMATSDTYSGGYGGYSTGDMELSKNTNLFINVGGKGTDSTAGAVATYEGGYNGGGNGYNHRSTSGTSGAGGGGATHIATISGELSTLESYKGELYDDELTYNSSNILIVAGGGGGAFTDDDGKGYSSIGGSGGGFEGTARTQVGACSSSCTTYNYPSGGTQLNGGLGVTSWSSGATSSTKYIGTFGQGSTGTSSYGGGGGGFYGGASGEYNGGGGGSGYIGNSLLTNKYMYCYNCTTSNEESTLTYTTTNVSENAISNYAKSGDGAAKISLLTFEKVVTFGLPYGDLPIPVKENYYFMGWNTESDGSGLMVTSESIYSYERDMVLYARWVLGLPGDANLDGVVNSSDESTLSTYILNPTGNPLTPEARVNADVNLDGSLDNDDIEVLQVYLEGGISSLPYEGEIYTINYDMNGGTGTIASQRKGYGTTITLSSVVPTIASELVFKGWATSANATNATYYANGNYSSNASVTLYAVWGYAINPITSYNCSNGSLGIEPYDLTYTGDCSVHDDGNGDWRVKFLSSGTLTLISSERIDVFLVGGGGGGGKAGGGTNKYNAGGGGGGGYTKTVTGINLVEGKNISIVIGAGGGGGYGCCKSTGDAGGNTSFSSDVLSYEVNGGNGGSGKSGGSGGSGGGNGAYSDHNGGYGGSDGEYGFAEYKYDNLEGSARGGGGGQGTTTREFGESTGDLYAGGGGGCAAVNSGGNSGDPGLGGAGGGGNGGDAGSGSSGVANTGGGGGGSYNQSSAGAGGSGIVIIRNTRD